MKKLLLAALTLIGLAAPIGATLPESGHAYKIKHQASDLWLNTEIDGRGDGVGSHCASLESEENASVVFFIQNPSNNAQWEIRTNYTNGPALGSNSNWNSIINNSTTYYWGLTEQEDGSFVITRNAAATMNGNVFAPNDGVHTAAAPIWTNKSLSEDAKWVIGSEVAIKTGPELTTDPANPTYYLIKNLRTNNGRGPTYAIAPGATGQIALRTQSELTEHNDRYDIGALWYFTPSDGRSDEATPYGYTAVNIYNALTGQALANVLGGDWRTEGDDIVWYICANSIGGLTGYNILSQPNIDQAWNNAAGQGYRVEYYSGNDVGSIFGFDAADETLTAKTLEAIITSRLPLAIEKGNVLKNLGVCTDEAIAAWDAAVAAASVEDTHATLEEYQAVVSAYINLQKSVKEVSIRIRHKSHEYEYIGVADNEDLDADINCVGDADDETVGQGTRVFTLTPADDGSGFYLYNIFKDRYVVHPNNDTNNVSTTQDKTQASIYNFDVWVNGTETDGSVGLYEINSKSDKAYLTSTDESIKLIRGAFNGPNASWYIAISSDEIVEENVYTRAMVLFTSQTNKANALASLEAISDEAKNAWNTASAAVEALDSYDEATFAAADEAYADLQSHIKENISITAKHKACNTDYISVNTQGNIVCVENRDGTRALTLSMADNGTGFNIFSEYAGKYLTHPAGDSQSVGLTADKSQASVYKFDVWVNDDKTVDSYLFCDVNTSANRAYLNTNAMLDIVTRWSYDNGSAWYIAMVDEDQAANEFLAGAKAYYSGMTFSSNVGEYSVSEAGKVAAEAAMAVDESASNDDKRQAGNTLRNLEMALNMPQPGHIYKFSKVDGTKALSCENRGTQRATMVEQNAANLFSTLFYLDEESRLVALEDGLVLGNFASSDTWQTVLPEQTEKVGTFTFAEAPQQGKYLISSQTGRYIYNANSDVDSGTNPNNTGYYWTITDQGIWTPIPGTDQDRTTVVLPFAMCRKPNMIFYTAKINNGKLALTEFTDEIIPGNTPFMLDLAPNVERDNTNHLVYLEKASSEGNEPDNNDLCGSIYAKIDTGYVVRNGNHFAHTDADFVEGFHAHIHTDKFHTISNPTIESAIDGLVGKVFAIKNTDTDNNRGYLIYNEATDAIWTSGKAGDTQLAIGAADTEAQANSNYHWTLVKDNNGLRYLYNIAAGKFAACYTEKGSNGGECEFVWHFADYPTAIDFCFLDYDMSTSLEGTTFNILGGEKTGAGTTVTRPAGMQIMNNNATHPVPGIAGHEANDGCGFMVIVIEDATASEVASADEALAAMEAEHSAAAEYIAGHTEELTELPGHYNADGYAAFTGALAGTADDSQAKYYKLVRARNAAGNNITEFADDQAYIIEGKYASIYWQGSKFYVDVETTDTGNADEYSNVWLCTKSGDNVNFTHTFQFKSGVTGEQIDRPAAARARFAPEAGTGAEVSMFAEHSAPTYKDGLGNISVADTDVKVLAKAEADDATTTGIREISAGASDADKTVYDLQGRRINRATRGLYIVDGVKTLVK